MLMMTVTVEFPFSNQQTFQEFLRLILFVNRAQSETTITLISASLTLACLILLYPIATNDI